MRSAGSVPRRELIVGLILGLVAAAATLACGKGVAQHIEAPALDEAAVARDTRLALEEARTLRREGRPDAALRTTRRALSLDPDSAALHRLQAELLEDLGRTDEAEAHRRRAAELVPPAPLPAEPLVASARDWLIVLLPPPDAERAHRRAPSVWPGGPEYAALSQRLGVRLPEARIADAPDQSDASVSSLQQWLAERTPRWVVSLQIERAWCGETIKDGSFAMVWMRAAVAAPALAAERAHRAMRDDDEPIRVREILPDPPDGPECATEAVARALEQLLAVPAVAEGFERTAPSEGAELGRVAIHRLFPEIERRIDLATEEGRRWLAVGSFEDARRAFETAAKIDPDDLDVRSYLSEMDARVELERQLARRRGQDLELSAAHWTTQAGDLQSPRRDFLEEQLRIEERRRQEMLAALHFLSAGQSAPDARTLDALRPSEISDPEARGPALARALLSDEATSPPVSAPASNRAYSASGGRSDLEVRVLHDSHGELVARYYFASGSTQPLLLEEDSRGDGEMDRWTAYRSGRRHQVWESGGETDPSQLHLVYAPDGETLERIEIDPTGAGRIERVFVYQTGRLASELRDTRGDGRFDQLQHFDEEGLVRLLEQDLDSDGSIDVRTTFNHGRILRREILNPEVASGTQ